jgi:hypothetical protein
MNEGLIALAVSYLVVYTYSYMHRSLGFFFFLASNGMFSGSRQGEGVRKPIILSHYSGPYCSLGNCALEKKVANARWPMEW